MQSINDLAPFIFAEGDNYNQLKGWIEEKAKTYFPLYYNPLTSQYTTINILKFSLIARPRRHKQKK